ncbi:membrane integrity-associated transporter subunit PqiC [uncultured Thiothrix sp.]|uniref:PqiC family protein n=1 Tax=uncultured Thiothrix sp. TaxID=223185 RepID=UPI002604E592|nr:PqiC family protein [uncultured Thiothrix sp.]HMT93471.1 PqiC family protein [Thiolinea sp.]
MGRALILLSCLVLSACSSVKPQYYTLGTPSLSSVENQHKPVNSIGVARIRLPSLLDRQGMVVRKDNFRVEVSEQAQWAGVLRDEVNESLVSGLQAALPNTRVQVAPWELEQTPQYYLMVNILEFDGAPQAEAKLRGSWQLLQGSSNRLLKAGSMSFKRSVVGKELQDVVQVQNELIGDLIRQVLAVLP